MYVRRAASRSVATCFLLSEISGTGGAVAAEVWLVLNCPNSWESQTGNNCVKTIQ
jgi:hypothetical protein